MSRPRLSAAFRHLTVFIVTGPVLLASRAAIAQSADASDRVKADARETERQLRQEKAEAERTHRLIEGFAASVRDARDALGMLETRVSALQKQAHDLLTNDDGKRIAEDRLAFLAYLRVRDEPPISLEQIRTRKKQADSIIQGLEAELKRLNVGWLPDPTQRRDADDLYSWAKSRIEQIERQESLLANAISRSPKDIDIAKTKTLEKEIQDHEARMMEAWLISKAQGEESAQKEAQEKIRESARIAQLEKAALEAERLLKEERAQFASMKAEYELMLQKRETEEYKRRVETETKLRDLAAEVDRLKQLADAKRYAKDVETKLASDTTVAEADKKRLIQKCHSPEVRDLLAPLLANGYTQPGTVELQYDKTPISYSKLVSFGALNPDRQGLCQLLAVLTWKGDKLRPRWKMSGRTFEQLSPEEIERSKSVQKLLIELGPILVEEKMLSP